MTDEFTKQYMRDIELCYQMINYATNSKETEHFKMSDIKELLLYFFPENIYNQALKKILGK